MSTMTVLDSTSVCRTLIVVFCCVVAVIQSETIVVNNEAFKIVHTQSGTVRGRENVTLFDGRVYYSFRGIPYARPPINELRFKPPQRPEPWKNIRDAFEYGNECVQTWENLNKTFGDEDCLFVNVFVPKMAVPDEKLPVMLFIHGGGYFMGSANGYGPDFLINNDVILVTFNYRLGPFGFLSLGTPEYSGNMGLKDQLLAIRWVNENIEQFGGDKSQITLFGESAGAASTHFQVLSPANRGLFQRAIIQSGSVLSPWAYSTRTNHLERLKQIANDEDALKQYILSADALVLSKKLDDPIYTPGSARVASAFTWSPVVEVADAIEPFMTEIPENVLRQASNKNLDVMLGYTDSEMILFTAAEYHNPALLDNFDAAFELEFPRKHHNYDYNSIEYRQMADDVREFYFPNGTKVSESWAKYSEMLSDIWMVYGVDQSAKLQNSRSTGKTYLYKFSMENELNVLKKECKFENVPGATHADDLFYIFRVLDSMFGENGGEVYTNMPSHSIEAEAIRMVTRLWTNFAKYGDPTPTDAVDFLPIDKDVINYADFTNDGLIPGVNPFAENINFWDNFYAKYPVTTDQQNAIDEDGIVVEDEEIIDEEGLIAAEKLIAAQAKLVKKAKKKSAKAAKVDESAQPESEQPATEQKVSKKSNKKLKQKSGETIVEETVETKTDPKAAEKLSKKAKKSKPKSGEQVVEEVVAEQEPVVEKVSKKTNKKQKSGEQVVEETATEAEVDPKAAKKSSKKIKQKSGEQVVVDETVAAEVDPKPAEKLSKKGKKSKQKPAEKAVDETATEEQTSETVVETEVDPKAAEKLSKKGKKSKQDKQQAVDQTGELNENLSKKSSKKSGKKSKEQAAAVDESTTSEQTVEKSGKKSKSNKKSGEKGTINESTGETKANKKSSKSEKSAGSKKSGKSKSSSKKGGAKEEL